MATDKKPLTFNDVMAVSIKRTNRWHSKKGLAEWSALEWAGAMCGEAGEAANAAKKLKRIENQTLNINDSSRQIDTLAKAERAIAKEVCDTFLYGLLLLASIGITDIDPYLIEVFNNKSDEYGFPEKL